MAAEPRRAKATDFACGWPSRCMLGDLFVLSEALPVSDASCVARPALLGAAGSLVVAPLVVRVWHARLGGRAHLAPLGRVGALAVDDAFFAGASAIFTFSCATPARKCGCEGRGNAACGKRVGDRSRCHANLAAVAP